MRTFHHSGQSCTQGRRKGNIMNPSELQQANKALVRAFCLGEWDRFKNLSEAHRRAWTNVMEGWGLRGVEADEAYEAYHHLCGHEPSSMEAEILRLHPHPQAASLAAGLAALLDGEEDWDATLAALAASGWEKGIFLAALRGLAIGVAGVSPADTLRLMMEL